MTLTISRNGWKETLCKLHSLVVSQIWLVSRAHLKRSLLATHPSPAHKGRWKAKECDWYHTSHGWNSTIEHRSRVQTRLMFLFLLSPVFGAVLSDAVHLYSYLTSKSRHIANHNICSCSIVLFLYFKGVNVNFLSCERSYLCCVVC